MKPTIEQIQIHGKRFQLEKIGGRFFLYKSGVRIGELIYGQAGLDKQYKGSFEKWVDKLKKRDTQRLENIESQIYNLEEERNILNERWR